MLKKYTCLLMALVCNDAILAAPEVMMVQGFESPAPDQTFVVTTDKDEVTDYTSVAFLDWSQEVASEYVESLNDGVDSFFMDAFFDEEVVEDEFSGSNGRLYFISRREDGLDPDYKVGLNLRLVLPNTRDRFKILVETDEEQDDVNETNLVDTPRNVTYSTAIRVDFKERHHWKTSFDNGIRWAGEPVYFSRIRVRRTDYFDIWRSRVLQTISWRTDEHWGANFNANAIRPLDFSRHFRMGFEADYLLDNDFAELQTSVGIFDELSSRAAMFYQLAVYGDTQDFTKVNETVFSISYRRKIYKSFVFAELVPEVAWPRENHFEATPAITLLLEMILGDH